MSKPFDLFAEFAKFGVQERISLRDPYTASAFITHVKDAVVRALADPAFVHGQRAEAMFEAMLVSLGDYSLLKPEDVGRIYPDDRFCVPDFRVVCPQARFTANFVKLGFHPGFGLTHTLPKLIGQQRANLMFMTGRRLDGETAYQWGLADVLTDLDSLRERALDLAVEIAENAPLAVMSVRATMREGLAEAVKRQTDIEFREQHRLQKTEDHKEGVRAVAERRVGNFKGR